MDRHLFIVAKDQVDLCSYLQREFSSEESVEVFLDRRQGERRSGRDRRAAPRTQAERDRRAAERRTRGDLDVQLRSLGYAMLRVG